MRLRTKFILHFSGLVAVTMTTVMAVVVSRQSAVLKDQATKRGLAIARNVAASCANSLLVYEMINLEQDASEIAALEDIVYVALFDQKGRQWAFSSRFGVDREEKRCHGKTVPQLFFHPRRPRPRLFRGLRGFVREKTNAAPFFRFSAPASCRRLVR